MNAALGPSQHSDHPCKTEPAVDIYGISENRKSHRCMPPEDAYTACRENPFIRPGFRTRSGGPMTDSASPCWHGSWVSLDAMGTNQSINIFIVLGGNWDPTDKKFSSVNSYRQDLLPTCKAFPKETTTCIWFTQSHKVCNSTTVLQEVQML